MCVDCEREVIAELRKDNAELREVIARVQADKDREARLLESFSIENARLRRELSEALADKIRYRELYREVSEDRFNLLRDLKNAKKDMHDQDKRLAETRAKAAKLDNLANVLRSVVD